MSDKILSAFHITQTQLLGEGGEAQVYALSEARIVFRMGANAADVAARTKLLAEIEAGAQHLTYETPIVLEQGEIFGRIYTIEKPIQGRFMGGVHRFGQFVPQGDAKRNHSEARGI